MAIPKKRKKACAAQNKSTTSARHGFFDNMILPYRIQLPETSGIFFRLLEY